MDEIDTDETTVRQRRRLRWVGLGVLVLIIVLILLFDGSRSRALDRAIQQARAGGRPFTLQEIEAARTAWPEDQNGATVLLAIKKPLSDLSKVNRFDPLPWIGDTPDPPLGEQWSDENRFDVQVFLQEVQPLLDQIDRLRDYHGGRLPFDTTADFVQILSQYDIGFIRTAGEIKSLQVLQRAMAGDNARLVDDLTILLNIGRLLDEEPLLVGAMVRVSCDVLTVPTFEQVCSFSTLDPSQLIEIDRLLTGIENIKRLYWGVLGERAGYYDTITNLNPLRDAVGSQKARWIPGLRGWLMQDQATGLRLLNRLVDAAANPENSLAIAQEVDLQAQQLSAIGYPLTKILLPGLNRAFELSLWLTARIRTARMAIAAERYRLEHASFPVSLGLLVPQYLDRVLLDPFTNQPLKYRLDGQRLVIYSLGEDLKDDGGDVRRKKKNVAPKDCGFTLLVPIERNRCSPFTTSSATLPADR